MINSETVLEALNKNEFISLLEGENGYRYEDKLCSGPTNAAMILSLIYKIYKEIDRNIIEVFMATLKTMISATSHDVYYATLYIVFQINREKKGLAPFEIDREYFQKILYDRFAEDKERFFQEKTIEGLDYSDGEAILKLADKLKDFGMSIV